MGALLEVAGIDAGYGPIQILRGVSLAIGRGQVVSLIGRNGMGKTTTVRTLMGQLPVRRGVIRFKGERIEGLADYRRAQQGITLVPEGRGIFPNLSVGENLLAGAGNRLGAEHPWSMAAVYDLFPRLRERARSRGTSLSGGEQQMLAIGRALMTNPLLLILDEATEGLAPLVRQEIWSCLETLKRAGLAMLVIDKNIGALGRLADRHYVMEKGQIAWQGSSEELRLDKAAVLARVSV